MTATISTTSQQLKYRLRQDDQWFVLEINLSTDADKWEWVYSYDGHPSAEDLVQCYFPIAIALRNYSGIVFVPTRYQERDGQWVPCQQEEEE
jgi:hypothetical protein